MSASPPRNGSPFLSLLFFLLGASALALTVTGNLWFGMSLAESRPAQYWQGGSAIYIDVMVAALAGACGWLFARRSFLSSTFVGGLALIFAAMSMVSLMGLGAMERIAKSRTVSAIQVSEKEITADKNIFAAGTHERNLSWLRTQASDRRLSASERRELRRELLAATKTGPDLSVSHPTTVMSDPLAEVTAEVTGLPVDRVQMLFVAALAALLIIGKGTCFWLAGYLSRSQKVSERLLSNPESVVDSVLDNTPSNVIDLAEVRGALPPVDKLGTVDHSQEMHHSFDECTTDDYECTTGSSPNGPHQTTEEVDQEVRRLGVQLREDLSRHVFNRQILTRFLADCTRPYEGGKTSASDLYRSYVIYCTKNNYSVLSQNQFGRLCTEAKLKRISNRRGQDYLDLVLVDEAGAEGVPQAVAA